MEGAISARWPAWPQSTKCRPWPSPTTATSLVPSGTIRPAKTPASSRSLAVKYMSRSKAAIGARPPAAWTHGSNHLVLLAKNDTGYRNLTKLVSKGYLEGYYYNPRIDKELLRQHADGLLCLSALCQRRSRPSHSARGRILGRKSRPRVHGHLRRRLLSGDPAPRQRRQSKDQRQPPENRSKGQRWPP